MANRSDAAPARRPPDVAENLRPFVGLSSELDRQLAQENGARCFVDAFDRDEGEWFFRLDRGAKRERFALTGAFAESGRAVEALARQGERNAVNHCLRHPWAYLRGRPFRQQTLEVARLDALLRHATKDAGPPENHAWSSGGMHASASWPGPVATFDLRERDWQRVVPRTQQELDRDRTHAYLGHTNGDGSLIELGCTYPVLVLNSLLAEGLAGPASELLASGCLLPRLVVEDGVSPAAADAGSDASKDSSDAHAWTSRRSPLGACLRGGGWRPSPGHVEASALLLAAGVRPSLRQRWQLRWAYRPAPVPALPAAEVTPVPAPSFWLCRPSSRGAARWWAGRTQIRRAEEARPCLAARIPDALPEEQA